MPFELKPTKEASGQLAKLRAGKADKSRYKAVCKALRYLREDPRHPSLNTHKYDSLSGPNGEPVFEAYAQNKTPGAYRIFFYYGIKEDKGALIIVAITPHP